jgi:hypothetical protein
VKALNTEGISLGKKGKKGKKGIVKRGLWGLGDGKKRFMGFRGW